MQCLAISRQRMEHLCLWSECQVASGRPEVYSLYDCTDLASLIEVELVIERMVCVLRLKKQFDASIMKIAGWLSNVCYSNISCLLCRSSLYHCFLIAMQTTTVNTENGQHICQSLICGHC